MGFELQMVVANRFAASGCSALIAGLLVVTKKCGHTLSRFHSSHVKLMGVQCFRLLQDLIRFALQTGTRIGEIFRYAGMTSISSRGSFRFVLRRPAVCAKFLSTILPGEFWIFSSDNDDALRTHKPACQAGRVKVLVPSSDNLVTMPRKPRFNLQNVTAEA